MKRRLVLMLSLCSTLLQAEVNVTSQFGFSATLPEGWFVVSPNAIAEMNQQQTLESLGIAEFAEPTTLNEILAKVKGGNVEFFYDKRYLNALNKNHISLQLGQPMGVRSVEEAEAECKNVPAYLDDLFGEPVDLLSCRLVSMNGWPVFHHAYTIPSQSITVINEMVHVNQQYSLIFVGGAGSDMEGVGRMRAAQQALIEAVVEDFQAQR